MAAFLTVPKSRLDLARILKANDYNIAQTTSFEDNIFYIFIRLASESDPILVKYRSKLVC